MKLVLIITLSLAILLTVVFYISAQRSKSGQAPGLKNNQLTHCPDKPNCVCSEYSDDAKHHISPLRYQQKHVDVLETLQDTIHRMGGEIQLAEEAYLAAIFKSDLFGFIDDLEIRLDTKNRLIHMRSASRVGYSDRGVNRKRIETLLGLLQSTPGFSLASKTRN